MKNERLRDFVMVSDGRIGLILANDLCGGVFRGHCRIWFGEFSDNNTPIVEHLCISKDWKVVECPIG